MTGTLRVAVVGLGSMGANHVRVLADIPGVALAGLADSDPACVSQMAARYGVPGFPDLATLLAEASPDAVSVVVPTQAHEEAVLQALGAGAHVLVEKPIAATLAAAGRMARAADNAGRLLSVGHVVRFNPAVQELRARLQAGQGGRVLQIVTERVGPFPHRIRDVGVIHDLGTHDIDLMRYLLDDEVERVYAEAKSHIATDHEDLATAVLHFRSGVVGSMEVNWLTPVKRRSLRVLCEKGMFTVDSDAPSLAFYENFAARAREGAIASVTEGPMTRYPVPSREPLRVELEQFLDAVRDGSPAPVSAADGAAALAVAEAMVASARSGAPATVADVQAGA